MIIYPIERMAKSVDLLVPHHRRGKGGPVIIGKLDNGHLRGAFRSIVKSIQRRQSRAQAGRYVWP